MIDFASVRIEPFRPIVALAFFAAGILPILPILADGGTEARWRNPGADRDPIALFNETMDRGAFILALEPTAGYLRSVLEYLRVPTESQILVFSSASFQAKLIDQENPRAIYFNDDIAIAWVRGSLSIEAAATDPGSGVAFYTLDQSAAGKPRFRREGSCLSCHQSQRTFGVPGLFVLSASPDHEGGGLVSDHRTPLTERWGGWYVTGLSSGFRHLGNRTGQGWLQSLYDQFDRSGYLADYSDIVALMIFEHQTQATNLITRLAWEMRTGGSEQQLNDAVNTLVDYLLFVDESPLPNRIIGTSGFRERFETLGPFDRRGRSLRQFDLHRRMMLYPCSYMIYSKAFIALPLAAKRLVYARMRDVLNGRSKEPRYARMSPSDRQAVLEILRDTKRDLPQYFGPVSAVEPRARINRP
ncbi:MAG: hypothetical protein C5B51_09645 [Terriglobia bacterium]|nr:MAG: hypothetical protein C5B51_09645 [Terriglobia bacterium]